LVQEPQWFGSVLVFTHPPEQFIGVDPEQPSVQAPAVHVAAPGPLSGPGQTVLHVPQLIGSVWVFVHVELHGSGMFAGHPASAPPSTTAM
jgi:hypothetical protein